MKLWDHRTPIDWAYKDHPSTIEEMENNPDYRYFLDTEIVLFDDGRNLVYSFSTLDELKSRYDIQIDNPTLALREIKRSMTHHIPTNTELDRHLSENKGLLSDQNNKLYSLASEVSTYSDTILAQNKNIEDSLEKSSKAYNISSDIQLASESNSQALEEIIPMTIESFSSTEANSSALEDIIPKVLDNSESLSANSSAIEDMIPLVLDNNSSSEVVAEAIEYLSLKVSDLQNLFESINERIGNIRLEIENLKDLNK